MNSQSAVTQNTTCQSNRSASESYSNIKQSIKKGNDADHRYGMIPMQNLLMIKLLTQIQSWVQLLSMLTTWPATCAVQRLPGKWEWVEYVSMCLSETAGVQSRINCRINWFLDSFYYCTFLSFVNWSRKGQNRNVPLSSGKLPVLSSFLGKMPALHSCNIFLTLSTLFRNWEKRKNQWMPNTGKHTVHLLYAFGRKKKNTTKHINSWSLLSRIIPGNQFLQDSVLYKCSFHIIL